MATVIGTGISAKLDSFTAGKEAALNAYHQIGKNDPSIIIIFVSTIFDQETAIKGVRSIIKDVPLIGCSVMGAISIYGPNRDSITVFMISSDSIAFSCGMGRNIGKNPRLAGHNAARQASGSRSGPKHLYMMFSDGMAGNHADILRGSQEILGTSFPVIGGGSSGRLCFQKTYQYASDEIQTDSVAGVLISGNIKSGEGKSNGWQAIGKPHKITKAKSNVIKEIDKKIAVQVYEEYFEKSFMELKNEGICQLGVSYPIGTRSGSNGEYITRVPLNIDESGGLVLNADIQEGGDISLMIGDKDTVLSSAKDAVAEAMGYIKNAKVKFAVMFSDISRLLLLRKDAYKEIDILKENIGKNTPILGCYTFGEYCGYFNNNSVSIALFSE
ncbi:MAG: FIST N-terminal domain-containing protein [Candidatus Omnitrophota bacterium]|jgi:hypothetical protein